MGQLTQTVTNTSAVSASQSISTGVFTTTTQAFTSGQIVQVSGNAPTGFSTGTNYYVLSTNLTSTSCELSATLNGSVIVPSASSSCSVVPVTNVNLTSVGLVDWAFWGGGATTVTANDYMSGAGHTIPNPTLIGSGGSVSGYGGDVRTMSYTNGTNTATVSNNALGIDAGGSAAGIGLQFVLPADTNVRTVYVYTGGYNLTSAPTITSSLSDSSASAQTDTTTLVGANGSSIDGVVQLVYAANSASQSLTLQIYIPGAGYQNVTLQAVALASIASGNTSLPISSLSFQNLGPG
jgi:hypothetical protein